MSLEAISKPQIAAEGSEKAFGNCDMNETYFWDATRALDKATQGSFNDNRKKER